MGKARLPRCKRCKAQFTQPPRGRRRDYCYGCKPSRTVKTDSAGSSTEDMTSAAGPDHQAGRPEREPQTTGPAQQRPESVSSASPLTVAPPAPTPTYSIQDRSEPAAGVVTAAGDRLYGYTEPRLATEPLRALTRATTLGYQVIDFAEQIGWPLLPWQQEVVKRGFELTSDGELRFRVVLVLVARQNGKSHLSRVISLWRMFVRNPGGMVLGAAQDLDTSREQMEKAAQLALDVPALKRGVRAVRHGNGKEAIELSPAVGGAVYKIVATNETAGRGKTICHVTFDEIRLQKDWASWGSLRKTITAVEDGQVWAISNAGDINATVLNSLRESALAGRDESLCLLEYSGADGCDLDDWDAIRHANPSMGHFKSMERDIRSSLGTDPPDLFRAEVLCQTVRQLEGAIDATAWQSCQDRAGTLEHSREQLAMCVEVAFEGDHISAVIAAEQADGRVRVEVAGAWSSVADARRELPTLIDKIDPAQLSYFAVGPSATFGTDLGRWHHDVRVISGSEVSACCQELAGLVKSRMLLHPGDDLLDAQVGNSRKVTQGDGWRFGRKSGSHVDAVYALAGAVHTARTLPVEDEPNEPLMVVAW